MDQHMAESESKLYLGALSNLGKESLYDQVKSQFLDLFTSIFSKCSR